MSNLFTSLDAIQFLSAAGPIPSNNQHGTASEATQLRTLEKMITASCIQTDDLEILADLEEEQETRFADRDEERKECTDGDASTMDVDEETRQNVKAAATGITDETNAAYKGQMKLCEQYLREKKLIGKDESFFRPDPPKDAPLMIVMWIMNSCDTIGQDGKPIPSTQTRKSYNHAQKMRAAVTHGFSRCHGLGKLPWKANMKTGETEGNPSVSDMVSSYMISLRRRKTRAGEMETTSARAIPNQSISDMYDFNHRPENYTIQPYAPKQDKGRLGPRFRRLLTLAYSIAFLCLLRFDEVLRIQAQDIELVKTKDGRTCLKLTLQFRKTSQFGAIQPFYLFEMPEVYQHLCPVRAYADWIHTTEITTGYIFRAMKTGDLVSPEPNDAMTSTQFLDGFRNNLLDISIDPTSYGTHSFRRGGCQFLSVDFRWPLRKICEWGGWSTDFSYMTIVKYLISWNDDPRNAREDFLDLNRKPTLYCYACGRSCECS